MKKLLTQGEVCKILRLSASSCYRKRKSVELNAVSERGKILYDPDVVEAWIKKRQCTPIPAPTVINPAKKQRQDEKAYRERQEAARQTLERHRVNRPSK